MNSKEIKFTEKLERWNYYTLSDGTILKLKIILIKVIKERDDPQGNPLFSLQTTNVIGISPSYPINENELKKKKDDINIVKEDVDWNEYSLGENVTLKLKPVIAQINRTGVFDPKGLPIYMVQAQPLIKLLK